MENKLMSLVEFTLHLHSMTTSELCKAYPNRFTLPVWNGTQSDMVKDMLAIDAIKWDMVKEYAKFLRKPLTLSMFVPTDEDLGAMRTPIVLFEGVEARKVKGVEDFYEVYESKNLATIWVSWNNSKNIESILHHNLTLTPHALKTLRH